MAVAYLASNIGTATGVTSVSSGTFDGSGSNRCVVAGVAINDNASQGPTGVDWDVASPQALTEGPNLDFDTYYHVAVWYLAGQTSATDEVTADFASTVDSVGVFGASFTGVDQSTPTGDSGTDSNTDFGGGSLSVTLTGQASDDMLVDAAMCFSSANALTAGANQTERETANTGGSYPIIIEMSTQDGADGGVMSWSQDSNRSDGMAALLLKAAAAGGGPTLPAGSLSLLGVGI